MDNGFSGHKLPVRTHVTHDVLRRLGGRVERNKDKSDDRNSNAYPRIAYAENGLDDTVDFTALDELV